jgi:hypothetical protein
LWELRAQRRRYEGCGTTMPIRLVATVAN